MTYACRKMDKPRWGDSAYRRLIGGILAVSADVAERVGFEPTVVIHLRGEGPPAIKKREG